MEWADRPHSLSHFITWSWSVNGMQLAGRLPRDIEIVKNFSSKGQQH